MTVVVIGSGIGGLSAAIRLQAAGEQVIVLEKNEQTGGKMGEIREGGFRWDTGPSVITMRHVLEDLFSAVGHRLEDYLTLEAAKPLTRYFYPDGTVLDASSDITRMVSQIQQLEPRDVEGYLAFLSYAARLHRIVGPVFIYDQPPSLASFLRVPFTDAIRVDGLRTMHQAIRSYVRSPHLRQLLGRFATYVGASPYQAPATLNVIAHVELNEGVYYPRGGIYQVADALYALADELGVEIRTGTEVDSIDVFDERVTGVTLMDGTSIKANAVVANVDVSTVYKRLLPRTTQAKQKLAAFERREPSCSGFILMLGVEGKHEDLAHHNVLFSADYPAEFNAIFNHGVPPEDPTIYVAITSKTDPEDAPAEHENWFVLVNAPPLGGSFDWEQRADGYRQLVLDKLAAKGFDVRGSIKTEHMLTPVEIQRMTGARHGALYGASSNNRWAAFRRPHNRASDVRGLYFAGGTTHPGGGVPMVALSGKVAANLILEDFAS